MYNKKGGFGAKLLLVLILMIASAIGGAYTYRVFDGKMAVRDAEKQIESVKVSDYDTPEAAQIEGYIKDAKTNLETATTRKEVYGIMDDFKGKVEGVMTKTQKELEQARKEAEEAKRAKEAQEAENAKKSDDSSSSNSSKDNSGNGIFNSIFGNKNDSSDSSNNSTDESTDKSDIFN